MVRPDWGALADAMTGAVVRPEDDGYDAARGLQIAAFDRIRPQAVVYCAGDADVQRALSFARRHEIPVHVRGGGHSLAGFSTGAGMVLDTSRISYVSLEGDRVRVGAGTQTVDVHAGLRGTGVTLPSGLCPTVGIAGLTLGGGVGLWTRKYGVTSDRLSAARVVLADGRIVDCDDEREPELFWALRGAGPAFFGVVTELTFTAVPDGDITTFLLIWPWERAARVFDAWQRWAPHAPDELASTLRIALDDAAPGAEPSVAVMGSWLGQDGPPLREALADFTTRVGSAPGQAQVFTKTHWDTMMFYFGCENRTVAESHREGTGPHAMLPRDGYVLTRGNFLTEPLPPTGITAVLAAFDSLRHTGQQRSLELGAMGGACNRIPSTATAFVHRDTLCFGGFTVEHATAAPGAAALHAAHEWMTVCRDALGEYASDRSYQNSPDAELTDWRTAYYGENYPRLSRARQTYDPDRVFSAHSQARRG